MEEDVNNKLKIKAKADSLEGRSNAIVVSFDFGWLAKLKRGSFSWVLRKRIPTSITPEYLYFHINSPLSALTARARIFEARPITRQEALAEKSKLDLKESEILDYFDKSDSMGVYLLGDIDLFSLPISVAEIANHMVYNPPQSFFILSKDAVSILDRICKFK